MKKVLKIRDLDCAHCAQKMEDAINKLDGVESAAVKFLTQKIILNADEARMDEIVKEVVRICNRVEPDCTIEL